MADDGQAKIIDGAQSETGQPQPVVRADSDKPDVRTARRVKKPQTPQADQSAAQASQSDAQAPITPEPVESASLQPAPAIKYDVTVVEQGDSYKLKITVDGGGVFFYAGGENLLHYAGQPAEWPSGLSRQEILFAYRPISELNTLRTKYGGDIAAAQKKEADFGTLERLMVQLFADRARLEGSLAAVRADGAAVEETYGKAQKQIAYLQEELKRASGSNLEKDMAVVSSGGEAIENAHRDVLAQSADLKDRLGRVPPVADKDLENKVGAEKIPEAVSTSVSKEPVPEGEAEFAARMNERAPAEKLYSITVSYQDGRFGIDDVEIKGLRPADTLARILEAYGKASSKFPNGMKFAKIRISGRQDALPTSMTLGELLLVDGALPFLDVYSPSIEEEAADIFGEPVTLASTPGKATKILNKKGETLAVNINGEFYKISDAFSEIRDGVEGPFYVNAVTGDLAPKELDAELEAAFEHVMSPPSGKDKAKGTPPLSGLPPSVPKKLEPQNNFDPDTGIATYVIDGNPMRYTVGYFGGVSVVEKPATRFAAEWQQRIVRNNLKALQEFYFAQQVKAKHQLRVSPRTAPSAEEDFGVIEPVKRIDIGGDEDAGAGSLEAKLNMPENTATQKVVQDIADLTAILKPQLTELEGKGADVTHIRSMLVDVDRFCAEGNYTMAMQTATKAVEAIKAGYTGQLAEDNIKTDSTVGGDAGGDADSIIKGIAPVAEESYECPSCGAEVGAADTKCKGCGVEFESDEADSAHSNDETNKPVAKPVASEASEALLPFDCARCGGAVGAKDKKCSYCGAEFEPVA